MSYPVVSENESASTAFFSTHYIDSPAAMSTKKVMDIGSRFLKAGNSRWHFGDTAIPLVGFVVGLIGIVLQIYATVKDKGKPKWLRAISLVALCFIAALSFTTFVLSTQFPLAALVLSFVTIGIGLAMQTVDFVSFLIYVIKAKFKVIFPPKQDNSAKIAELNTKHAMLLKRQTSIIVNLHHEKDINQRSVLSQKLNLTHNQMIKINKLKQKFQNPFEHSKKEYDKAKQSFKSAFFSMAISLGSSAIAIMGLTLAVGNPPLGLFLFGCGLLFDAFVLSRKVNKWCRHRVKEKRKQQENQQQRKILIQESVKTLKKEREACQQSFSLVTKELLANQSGAVNDWTFQNNYFQKAADKSLATESKSKFFFLETNFINNESANNNSTGKQVTP